MINTTVGILGFLNPAEKMGLKPHKEDVGQTLGAYGIGPGCYFVLPILGPTTARDSLGIIADTFVDPFAHVTLRENELFSMSGNEFDFYSLKGTDVEEIKKKTQDLVQASMKLGEAIYKSQQSTKPGDAPKDAKDEGKKDDNVVDADFEEVKDDKEKSA